MAVLKLAGVVQSMCRPLGEGRHMLCRSGLLLTLAHFQPGKELLDRPMDAVAAA
jgi:hypothetical protein